MTHLVGIEDRKHARSMIKMVRCEDALADMEPETNKVRLFLEDGASLDRATVWLVRENKAMSIKEHRERECTHPYWGGVV